MRVLHIFNKYLDSTVNWAYNMIGNLPDCEILVSSPRFTKNKFYDDHIEYIQYPLQYLLPGGTGKRNDLWTRVEHRILIQRYGNHSKFLGQYLKDYPVDIIHVHFGHVGCAYIDLAKKLKIPYVVSFYGLDYEFIPKTIPKYRTLYKSLFKEASALICEGSYGASILEKQGCSTQKIEVVRLGVIIDAISFHSRIKQPSRLSLVQIASFKEKKGYSYTVKAFHDALKKCPNMHLTLVGGGSKEERTKIKNLVSELKLEDYVTFWPKIELSELHSFLHKFDVFIHPSCHAADGNCEGGAPVVLLDAQATGLPIISTKHCDIPEEVIDSVTGILVEEHQVSPLAEAITKFYNMDSSNYRQFSDNARKHIEDNYNIRRNAINMSELYKKIKLTTSAN